MRQMSENSRSHRNFHVDGKLEFALFFDPNVKDKEKIVNDFLDSRDWKWWADYNKFEVDSWSISEDLINVYIITKPLGRKTMKKEKVKETAEKPVLDASNGGTPFSDGKWRLCILEIVSEGEVVYTDKLGVKTREEYATANKTLSDKPERIEFAKKWQKENKGATKLTYKFSVKKVNPDSGKTA